MSVEAPARRGVPHMPGLDGVRALAVMGVIAFHHSIGRAREATWLPGGWLGVSTFFTLSGFLITTLLLAERADTGRVALVDFWSRRAKRLLPALMVLLATCLLLARTRAVPAQPNLGSAVVAALLYTKNLLDLYGHGGQAEITAHLWSLSIEEQFYLAFPVLFLLARRLGRWWPGATAFAGLAVTSFAVGTWYDRHGRFYFTYSTLQGRAVELLVGVVLAFALAHPRWRAANAVRAVQVGAQVVGAAGLAGMAVLWHRSNVFSTHIHLTIAQNALATAALIVGATGAGPVVAALSVAPLRWVGKVSYGAYLYHSPVFWVLTPARLGHPSWWVVVGARVAVLAVVCELSFRFVEAPIRRWKPSRRWHVVPAFAIPMAALGAVALVLHLPAH